MPVQEIRTRTLLKKSVGRLIRTAKIPLAKALQGLQVDSYLFPIQLFVPEFVVILYKEHELS